jgi:large subunit ribosomal protein L4
MPEIKIYNQKGEAVGDLKLSDKVFGVKVNEALVYQAVVTQMANERQVLAHTKDRSEVRGGGKKPWRQKGTGRARHGSIRSPIWIGGGVTFGPTSARNFSKKINKKMKQKSIFMALSDKVANNNLVILDKLEMDEFKTKAFNEMIENLLNGSKKAEPAEEKKQENTPLRQGFEGQAKTRKQIKRSVLVINDKKDDKVKYSGRNLVGVKVINLDNINILDLLKYRDLVMTAEAVKKLEKRY